MEFVCINFMCCDFIHWLALVIFGGIFRVFYAEGHVTFKQWEFYFFSYLDSWNFIFFSDCYGQDFQNYTE